MSAGKDWRAPLILDGGLASELQSRGADLSDPLWSAKLLIENPALIRQVHEDYFEAGADLATSASYQATFEGFARRGLDARPLLGLAVQLAKDARDRVKPSGLVAASLGSFGASLADGAEFRGHFGLSPTQLADWHRPRLETLLYAEPDLLAFETIPCLEEAEAIVRLLEEFPSLPAWVSFSCRNGRELCQGQRFSEAYDLLRSSQSVWAIGINCTAPEHVSNLLATLPTERDKAVVVYPNQGEAWDPQTRSWIERSDEPDWSELARTWQAAGVRGIGGCCRTTPETIRQIARAKAQGWRSLGTPE